jgi:hypothetical protein
MEAGTMRIPLHPARGGREERPVAEQGPGELLVTGAAVDVRVQAARDRLAEVPSDDVLVRLDARSLAAVAGKAVMAAQLLDASIRDAGRAGHRDGGAPVALALDAGRAATVLAALDDAAALRREVTIWCPDCRATPTGLCEDHCASVEAADTYDRLRGQLEAQAPAARPAERQAGWEAVS